MKVSPNRRNKSSLITNISASLALDFEVTCDIILGTAPTNAVCETRRDGRAEVLAADGTVDVSAIVADASLDGTAGRRRRSAIRREASSEYQESTG